MATAHWHFTKAEELLAEVTNDDGSISFGDDCNGEIIAVAQVHATLAHAAALGANEQPGVPSPRSLDPRHNQKNGTRRRTDRKSPTASPVRDS